MFLSRGASTTWLIVDSQASPCPVNRKAHMGGAAWERLDAICKEESQDANRDIITRIVQVQNYYLVNHRMQIEILLLQ